MVTVFLDEDGIQPLEQRDTPVAFEPNDQNSVRGPPSTGQRVDGPPNLYGVFADFQLPGSGPHPANQTCARLDSHCAVDVITMIYICSLECDLYIYTLIDGLQY